MESARLATRVRTCALAALSLLLPGCPLSDKYFVESESGNQNAGGLNGTGGSSVLATGGVSTAGTTASGGTSDAGSSSVVTCIANECSGTCCNGTCVDNLTSDPTNCGACETACLAGQACVASKCVGGWSAIASPPGGFLAREKSTYVTMGDSLFIFGGVDVSGNNLGDGAIYNATTNRWKLVSIDANTPSPRRHATAVWTGSVIVIYGGRADMVSVGYRDGAIYDPSTDKWSAIPSGANGRVGAIGTANSSQVAFWGVWGANSVPITGTDRLDLGSYLWASATSPTNTDPGALDGPAWAFTGQYLYLCGGRINGTTKTSQGWSYALATNSWSSLAGTGGGLGQGPSARWGAFGVWDGNSFAVWAGRDDFNAKSDGQMLTGAQWTAMPQLGAPTARWAPHRQTGWAFARATGDLLFIGGQDVNGNCLGDGGHYISGSGSTAGSWTTIPRWNAVDDHQWGAAAYIGGALVVWGGRTGTELVTSGQRWAP